MTAPANRFLEGSILRSVLALAIPAKGNWKRRRLVPARDDELADRVALEASGSGGASA